MRFKVDESLHIEVADLLRAQGHDALTVFDQGLRGCGDHDIAERCRSENRVLLSLDLDFSNILMFPPEHYPGLIVLGGAGGDVVKLFKKLYFLRGWCHPEEVRCHP